MKKIKFSKLNGQGNDFILIDATVENILLTDEEIRRLCGRHFGIGADGVILVRKSSKADFFMDYYNSDGTTAEMCGNGIRCMSKFIYDGNLTYDKSILVETRAGIKKVDMELLENNEVGEIQVDMGFPIFNPEKIPVNIKLLSSEIVSDSNKSQAKKLYLNKYFKESGKEYIDTVFNYELKIGNENYIINCLSMGNPHCIIFLKKNESLDQINLHGLGPKIENHPFFPKKTNVEFIKVENINEISMLVWERGCGETLACGTGACASAVAAIMLGRVNSNIVKVNLKGGTLNILWNGNENDSVFLKGAVSLNFTGNILLN
ncbi:diaminopimelate epimerase [bacterium]|nr:diaminopimelate epimerase [bacterium]